MFTHSTTLLIITAWLGSLFNLVGWQIRPWDQVESPAFLDTSVKNTISKRGRPTNFARAPDLRCMVASPKSGNISVSLNKCLPHLCASRRTPTIQSLIGDIIPVLEITTLSAVGKQFCALVTARSGDVLPEVWVHRSGTTALNTSRDTGNVLSIFG